MRRFAGLLAIGVIVGGTAITSDASAQLFPRTNAAPAPAAAPATPAAPSAAATPAPPPGPTAAIPGVSPAKQPCNNSDALGIGRVAGLDTPRGPGFGFEPFQPRDL